MRRRATAMELCVTHVEGHVCAECGTPRPASGELRGAGGKPCNARSCPRCARRNSMKLAHWGRDLVDKVVEVPGYEWRFITLTSQYDPTDPEAVTVEALQYRIAQLRKVWRAVWRRQLKRPGAGAWISFEMGLTGMIHIHALYYGPFVHGETFSSIAAATWERCRIKDITIVREPRGAVAELLKYSIKSPGTRPEAARWFAGKPRLLGHPQLVARWEVATYGAHLNDRYGSFRDHGRPEDAERDEAVVHNGPCVKCHTVGRWQRASWPIKAWIMFCHQEGVLAFGHKPERPPPGEDLRGGTPYERRDETGRVDY